MAQIPQTPHRPPPTGGGLAGHPVSVFRAAGADCVCTIDRPEARNAMTPAMCFGIRYGVRRINADRTWPGSDHRHRRRLRARWRHDWRRRRDDWITFGAALGMDVTPFDAVRTRASRSSPRSMDYARAAVSRSRCVATCPW